MDYHQKLGLERVIAAEGLTPEDLKFIGMLDILEKDIRTIKIQRIGLDNMLYEIQLRNKMDCGAIKGLFKEHCFQEPSYIGEVAAEGDLKVYLFIFGVNGHAYRIIVQNPKPDTIKAPSD